MQLVSISMNNNTLQPTGSMQQKPVGMFLAVAGSGGGRVLGGA